MLQLKVMGAVVEIAIYDRPWDMLSGPQGAMVRIQRKVTEPVRPHDVVRLRARVQTLGSPSATGGAGAVHKHDSRHRNVRLPVRCAAQGPGLQPGGFEIRLGHGQALPTYG